MKKTVKQSEKVRIIGIRNIILMAILVVLFFSMVVSNKSIREKYDDQYNLVEAARKYQKGSENLTNAVRGYAATKDIKYYNDYYNELNQEKNRDIALTEMKRIGITQKEQGYIDLISSTSNNLVPLEEQAMKDVLESKLQEAIDTVYGTAYEDSFTIIHETTQKLIDEIAARMADETAKANKITIFINIICSISVVLVVISVISLVSFVKKELITPLPLVLEQMQAISNGNFSAPFALQKDESEVGVLVGAIIETKNILRSIIREIAYVLEEMAHKKFDIKIKETYVGELSEIRTSFEKILDNLNETFYGISRTTQKVSEGASQLAVASEELAEGAEQQADAVNEILLTLNQMKEVCMEDACAAEESAQVAKKTENSLAQSDEQMKALKEAIYEINQSSEQIGGIINTINSIATETNLLALNAAIEAARAGQSGRGFAVVAEHVKELASASADAANTTTDLIKNSIALIQKGTQIAEQTSAELEDVKTGAEHTFNRMAKLTQSSKDKVKKMEEITLRLNQIAQTVERNSAASQQTAATSEAQSNETRELDDMINKFQLRKR